MLLLSGPLLAQTNTDSTPLPQTADTIPVPDSPRIKRNIVEERPTRLNPYADSFSKMPVQQPASWNLDSSQPFNLEILKHNPYFRKTGSNTPTFYQIERVPAEGKELIFYVIIGLLLLFAFLRHAFGKYFNNLFRLFFRTTMKYRQIREQLMQTPLPSLLLNGFFVICGGMYISFLLVHFGLIDSDDFWLYFLYSGLGLITIYFVKFMGLKVIGWIFNMREAANSYIFIVFVVNKIIGVFLLPFIVMLAFMSGTGYSVALVLSWFGLAGLLLYRFILSYAAVRNQVRFNPFHFFLYLLAFEIAPLLLIYKLLLVFFQ